MEKYRRFAGPAALLLAVTIAVVLIRVFAEHHHHPSAAPSTGSTITVTLKRKTWTVKAGDTLPKISAAAGVPLATIRRLNPHVTATNLFIGEKLKLR